MDHHTPAPWKAEKDPLFPQWGIAASAPLPLGQPGKLYVAKVIGYAEVDVETEANARLIAAAPDMLAALRLQREAQAHAQAASDATPDGQTISKTIHDEVLTWFARAERAATAAIAKAEGR